jgi:RNA polymerase sigma factor (TIGR02999 family)
MNEERVSDPLAGEGDGGGPIPPGPREVTRLLAAWSQGDRAALTELTRLVYQELRRLAHHYMERQAGGHTLQTTALVNEAYLRLANQEQPSFANRSHFLAVAATAMRQILVDHAEGFGAPETRRRHQGTDAGRGGVVSPEPMRELVDLNEALDRLATLDSRRPGSSSSAYFGGLNRDEIAEVLKVSTVTIRRDWVFARAWLYSELRSAGQPQP